MSFPYKRIIIVCTANACRSVLAEQYMHKRLHDINCTHITVSSAGTSASPLFMVPGSVIRMLHKEGVQYMDHVPVTITEKLAEEADAILCMEQQHIGNLRTRFPKKAAAIMLLHECATGRKKDIIDPINQADDFYQVAFNEIKNCIEEIIKKIQTEDSNI